MDACVTTYQRSLRSYYPAQASLTYASKAFLCTAMTQWAQRNKLALDCSSAGELHIAMAGGAKRQSLLVHGVNKSPQDLRLAIEHAGTLVVDNLVELDRLVQLAHQGNGPFPDVWLRLRPGQAVDTHEYIRTGHTESKFGMDFDEAAQAVRCCLEAGLPLTGLHFHLGSRLRDPAPLVSAITYMVHFISAMRKQLGWLPQHFSPGGGWDVAYHEDELPQPPIKGYVQAVAATLVDACAMCELPLFHLHLEPGRGLVGRAGVALYRLGAIKRTGERRWLLLDGGLADNPRPALYGARYSALPVKDPQRPATAKAWVGGPFCESGDVLIEGLPLPDMAPGELIAVPVSGAYQLSMSSNYNGACRPAVVWLADGKAHLIQRRETSTDLISRDLPF
jgi:diaminopimelate decarboxylase